MAANRTSREGARSGSRFPPTRNAQVSPRFADVVLARIVSTSLRRVRITPWHQIVLLSALLLGAVCSHAQGREATPSPTNCSSEIPVGVKVIKLPKAEQDKVAISEFSVSPRADAATYDLTMRIKNGTDNWCITSFGFAYVLGDARGQQWVANEYPAVVQFRTQPDSTATAKAGKTSSAAKAGPHPIGIPPGQEEKRTVFDLYNYIQPRPPSAFDGFHLIAADLKYCLGYALTKTQ